MRALQAKPKSCARAGPGLTPSPARLRRLSHNELRGVAATLRWCWQKNFLKRRRNGEHAS